MHLVDAMSACEGLEEHDGCLGGRKVATAAVARTVCQPDGVLCLGSKADECMHPVGLESSQQRLGFNLGG